MSYLISKCVSARRVSELEGGQRMEDRYVCPSIHKRVNGGMAESGVAAGLSSYPTGARAAQIERALQLCLEAERAVHTAARIRADTQRRRSERRHWAEIQTAYQSGSRDVMRCCAYCARMPGPNGDWGAIPPGITQFLHSGISGNVPLSHAYCPDCMDRHFRTSQETK